jgi:hypothetical protein
MSVAKSLYLLKVDQDSGNTINMLRQLLLIFVCVSNKQVPMAGESWKVPTPVKDLAALVEEPPSRFVQREEDRPGSLMVAADMPDPLPIVDLDKLSTADEAAKLRSALQTWGLFLVRSIPCCFFFSLSNGSHAASWCEHCSIAASHACNGYLCAIPCRLPTMA